MLVEAGEQLQGFAHRQLFREPRLLQRDAQPFAQFALMRLPCPAEDFDFAGRRLQQAFENFDGGGLPGAIRAQQAETLARIDGQVESAHGLDFAVIGLAQTTACNGNRHLTMINAEAENAWRQAV